MAYKITLYVAAFWALIPIGHPYFRYDNHWYHITNNYSSRDMPSENQGYYIIVFLRHFICCKADSWPIAISLYRTWKKCPQKSIWRYVHEKSNRPITKTTTGCGPPNIPHHSLVNGRNAICMLCNMHLHHITFKSHANPHGCCWCPGALGPLFTNID